LWLGFSIVLFQILCAQHASARHKSNSVTTCSAQSKCLKLIPVGECISVQEASVGEVLYCQYCLSWEPTVNTWYTSSCRAGPYDDMDYVCPIAAQATSTFATSSVFVSTVDQQGVAGVIPTDPGEPLRKWKAGSGQQGVNTCQFARFEVGRQVDVIGWNVKDGNGDCGCDDTSISGFSSHCSPASQLTECNDMYNYNQCQWTFQIALSTGKQG
jgi:hypothetical protein